MAKGRKPEGEHAVIPMREDGAPHNLEERARAKLLSLTPHDLEEGPLLWTFRRLGLPLCHPTRDRLDEATVFMFLQLCRAVVRQEALAAVLDEEGETYTAKTRNGTQIKARPEVAQLNECFRQIRGLAGEFGMTPQTARGLAGGPGQLGFQFGDDPDDEYRT